MYKYFLIILCFSGFELQAQIKNQKFKLMLDSLYEHSVPLISVEDLIKLNKKKSIHFGYSLRRRIQC